MLKAKNLEAEGLARDIWNHIAFLTRQNWQTRQEIRSWLAQGRNPLVIGTDEGRFNARKLEIEWLRDMVQEYA